MKAKKITKATGVEKIAESMCSESVKYAIPSFLITETGNQCLFDHHWNILILCRLMTGARVLLHHYVAIALTFVSLVSYQITMQGIQICNAIFIFVKLCQIELKQELG